MGNVKTAVVMEQTVRMALKPEEATVRMALALDHDWIAGNTF
ncbi:hypothetical protein [Methanofollis aquaemaris]|nr:hypothetical protein [Methanofollis aquaemaris]